MSHDPQPRNHALAEERAELGSAGVAAPVVAPLGVQAHVRDQAAFGGGEQRVGDAVQV
eukprot:CAMPEP_0171633306 /NCGR_PEP_ID=MMETSP0990-20121206/25080_1 /TAXON_ID=483369 /ORGANISM="non described non described, Strain CCMP2098" /LENGTH=57 /DNA_ID=CAMNT_0012203909 /DNA_START=127 /DNA_END=300 /DNA_ORIENTATION=-